MEPPGHAERLEALERKHARYIADAICLRRIFGVEVKIYPLAGFYWWRCTAWGKNRRSFGTYRTRQEAIRDCARKLHSLPELRGRREEKDGAA